MNVAVLSAQDWRGRRIPATFSVAADDAPVAVDDSAPVPSFHVPDGVSRLHVTATPTTDAFWTAEATYSVAADGSIAADDAATGTTAGLGALGSRLTVLTTRVWRLRDASAKVRDLLEPAARPKLRLGQPAEDLHMFDGTDYPPSSWTIFDRDGIRFVDPDAPITGNRVTTRPPRPVAFDGESVVLELAGVGAPRLLAVTWPASIAPTDDADPTPFLVYFRPGVGQEVRHGFYLGGTLEPYPFNHDYAYYGLYQYLWYLGDPITVRASPKGIPHQIDESGRKVVTVLPCNAVGREFGAFMDAGTIREVLLEIQAYMFARASIAAPPSALGRVALAAFSSGNGFLAGILASPANRADPLLADTVREVYLFDPPRGLVDSVVAAALTWAGAPADGRRIAIYNQFPHPAHARLLGVTSLPVAPFVETAQSDTRTVGVIDVPAWKRTVEAEAGGPWPGFDWRNVHQLIPSTMLVHALATSRF